MNQMQQILYFLYGQYYIKNKRELERQYKSNPIAFQNAYRSKMAQSMPVSEESRQQAIELATPYLDPNAKYKNAKDIIEIEDPTSLYQTNDNGFIIYSNKYSQDEAANAFNELDQSGLIDDDIKGITTTRFRVVPPEKTQTPKRTKKTTRVVKTVVLDDFYVNLGVKDIPTAHKLIDAYKRDWNMKKSGYKGVSFKSWFHSRGKYYLDNTGEWDQTRYDDHVSKLVEWGNAFNKSLINNREKANSDYDSSYLQYLIKFGYENGIISEQDIENKQVSYSQLVDCMNKAPLPSADYQKNNKGYKKIKHAIQTHNINQLSQFMANLMWTAILAPGMGAAAPTIKTGISTAVAVGTPMIAETAWQKTHNGKSQGESLYETIYGTSPDELSNYYTNWLIHTAESAAAGMGTNAILKNAGPMFSNFSRNQVRMSAVEGVTNSGRFVKTGEMLYPGESVVKPAGSSTPKAHFGSEGKGGRWGGQGSSKGTRRHGSSSQGRKGYQTTVGGGTSGTVSHFESQPTAAPSREVVIDPTINPQVVPLVRPDIIAFPYALPGDPNMPIPNQPTFIPMPPPELPPFDPPGG